MAIYIQGVRVRPIRLIVIALVILCGLHLIRNSFVDDDAGSGIDAKHDPEFVPFRGQMDRNKLHKGMKQEEKDHTEITEEFLKLMDRRTRRCPDYVEYSQHRHAPYSNGKHKFPYMRPAPKCRTFKSEAVEKLVSDLKRKVQDDDLARLIENCLPNTLDTTILWHKPGKVGKSGKAVTSEPQSFVVTGDIHAEWLRDAARQLSVYQPLIKYDEQLKELIRGAINTQSYYVANSPYCNAFHPPPDSGVKKGNTARDQVFPLPDWHQVFECKYELDSLASFLTLTNDYYENSGGDLSFLNELWLAAFHKLLIVLNREKRASFDKETGQALSFAYSFQRQTNIGSETLPLGGVGNPVNFNTGLIRSAFRPSDDACVFQLFIPANAHMVTELKRARNGFLKKENYETGNIESFISHTDSFIDSITNGIQDFGIVDHPKWGKVYAFEVDGYGSAIHMDDANIPSLLALPDMGFVDVKDEVYQNTRNMILSKSGNPYYLNGRFFKGIGGPHVGIYNAWPMSLLIRIRTSDDDNEILDSLHLIMEHTAGLGLMHESINVNSRGGKDFTRSWFAWCNSEFGKTILDLAQRKPHLIFKPEFAQKPYSISEALN